MSPRFRKLSLTAHLTASMGWVGAVVTFAVLAAIGLTSADAATVRGVYLVMEPAAWFVLVPLAVLSTLTGIAQSLGTPWGLFRHQWVVVKLAVTVASTAVLLVYLRTFQAMAARAADPAAGLDAVRNPSPLVHAGLALVLLLFATVLGVYKPRGLTRFGRRRVQEPAAAHAAAPGRAH